MSRYERLILSNRATVLPASEEKKSIIEMKYQGKIRSMCLIKSSYSKCVSLSKTIQSPVTKSLSEEVNIKDFTSDACILPCVIN